MPVLTDPIDRGVKRSLRRAVLDYRAAPRPGAIVLHAGDPMGVRVRYDVRRDEALDAALRADVVAALLLRLTAPAGAQPTTTAFVAGVGGLLLWLSRPGRLDWEDADADWLGAARTAFAEAAEPLTFVVVTRDGWVDPRSGAGVVWKRLRDRRRPPAG